MGLSKKLGVLSKKSSQVEALEVGYKWSNQTYTLHDIIRKFKMPCVVQCATDPCCVLWSDFQFDLRQPLLLFSARSIQKVHAISVEEDSSKQILQELDPPLAIPKDFEGWFGARPKGVEKFKYHKNIEGVAQSTASRFLVTSKCSAFTSVKSTGGNKCQYKDREITPGEVFRKVCVIEDDSENGALERLIRDYGPCLTCLDEKDDDALIPLANEAVCYELAEMYPDNSEQIFRISSLVEGGNSKLPRVLQLLYGDPPVLNYSFTGMLRCYSVFTEETILAAVLDPNKSMCLELATDSATKFKLALNESVIKKTIEYTNTHHLCDTFGPKFLTGIKVSFSLKPIITGKEEASLASVESDAHDTNDSDTNDSDTQDISADSEFDVEWRSGMANQCNHSGTKISSENVSKNRQKGAIQNGNHQIESGQKSDGAHSHQHAVEVTEEVSSILSQEICYKPEESENEKEISDDESSYDIQVQSNLGVSKNFGKSENIFSLIHSNLTSTASIDKVGQGSVDEAPSGNENPLLYLFQPIKTSSGDSGVKFHPIDTQSQQNEIISHPQVYHTAAYKPPREYVDLQCDEDNPDCEDGLEDEVIISSNIEINLDGNANIAFEIPSRAEETFENVYYPSNKDSNGTKFEIERNMIEISTERSNRLTETILQVKGTNFWNQEDYAQDENSDSETEYDMEDILSLAATESEKLSTLTSNGLPDRATERLEHLVESQSVNSNYEKSALLGRKVSSESFTSQESFARFNSLIEEVTALVNTSSCRIIGASHRIQKHRNRLHVQKNKNDNGYIELVSSTETIPDLPPLAAASVTPSESTVAASKIPDTPVESGVRPLIPHPERMVPKPSSLPFLNQTNSSAKTCDIKFTPNSLYDLTTFSNGVYNSEKTNLLPKYNHNGPVDFNSSRGQFNTIDALSPRFPIEEVETRTADASLKERNNQMTDEKRNSSHSHQQRCADSRHYSLQPHSGKTIQESPIYNNIPFTKQSVENVELLTPSASLNSIDSDLTSVSSINSVLCQSGKVSRLPDDVLHGDQTRINQFWI